MVTQCSEEKKALKDIISDLKDEFSLASEGDAALFLGTKIQKLDRKLKHSVSR